MAHCIVRGSINVDEFLRVKRISRPGETISSTNLEARAGGKGANQASSIAKAGGSVDFLGSIGKGRGDDWVVQRIKEFGVGVGKVEYVEEKTGRAIIQVAENGENSIVLFKGANYHNRTPTPSDLVPRPTHLVVQNEIPLDSTIAYLALANQTPNSKKITTIFNPSPLPTEDEIRTFPWENVSWLVVNEGEASELVAAFALNGMDSDRSSPLGLGLGGVDSEGDVEKASELLKKLYTSLGSTSTNVVLTLGSTGVIATYPSHQSPTNQHSSSSSWNPVFVPSIKLQGCVRDTTGAGDCFTGYFVAELMKHWQGSESEADIGEAGMRRMLGRCVVAAGMCCEKEGTLDSVPLREEVDVRIQELEA